MNLKYDCILFIRLIKNLINHLLLRYDFLNRNCYHWLHIVRLGHLLIREMELVLIFVVLGVFVSVMEICRESCYYYNIKIDKYKINTKIYKNK